MTSVEHPVRRGPERIPFPVVDEVSRHCLQEDEPETVHIEVHLPGRLDRARLRAAFAKALHRHPRILVHEAPGRWYSRRYAWELTPGPEAEVVSFTPAGADALRNARTRALSQAPPLTLSPPIRLEVVEGAGSSVTGPSIAGSSMTGSSAAGPSAAGSSAAESQAVAAGPGTTTTTGTVLVLTINHTALDGPACLRILATAAELYGGRDNSPAAPPVRPPATVQEPPDTLTTWIPPARVAKGDPHSSPGNGLLVTELFLPRRPRSAPYTVNDQLMVTYV